MTDHPLTDEKLFKQFWDYTCGPTPMGDVLYTPDGVRAAADWQLEQVIAWLDDTDCDDPQETAQRLKQAMRPQQQEDN